MQILLIIWSCYVILFTVGIFYTGCPFNKTAQAMLSILALGAGINILRLLGVL